MKRRNVCTAAMALGLGLSTLACGTKGGPITTWTPKGFRFSTAFQGAWGARHSHRTNSVTCGDIGPARTEFTVNGSLQSFVNVPYGQCWTTGHDEGPRFLGINLEGDLKHTVTCPRHRSICWLFADEDQFL